MLDGVLQVADSVLDIVMAPDVFKGLVWELIELCALFVGLLSQLHQLLNAARLDNVRGEFALVIRECHPSR